MSTIKERFAEKFGYMAEPDFVDMTQQHADFKAFIKEELNRLAEEYDKQAAEYDTAGIEHADGVATGLRKAATIIRTQANSL